MTKTTRYIVWWTPTAEVERMCRQLGMKDDDGTSFWDWIEPDHCREEREFPAFDQAVSFSRSVAAHDAFGCARIERQRLVRYGRQRIWETDAAWEADPDVKLVEAEPDILPEAA